MAGRLARPLHQGLAMTDTHDSQTREQVPPLPDTLAVRRALDEIATAVAADVAPLTDAFSRANQMLPSRRLPSVPSTTRSLLM
ncbi:hypothetical protein AYO47_03485 [Planctomyces sp. SCGC AG-212-M04]|nr:hypothetical protein AYO47_03485 [Planctomyces sp. SCGC AG-212-M04]